MALPTSLPSRILPLLLITFLDFWGKVAASRPQHFQARLQQASIQSLRSWVQSSCIDASKELSIVGMGGGSDIETANMVLQVLKPEFSNMSMKVLSADNPKHFAKLKENYTWGQVIDKSDLVLKDPAWMQGGEFYEKPFPLTELGSVTEDGMKAFLKAALTVLPESMDKVYKTIDTMRFVKTIDHQLFRKGFRPSELAMGLNKARWRGNEPDWFLRVSGKWPMNPSGTNFVGVDPEWTELWSEFANHMSPLLKQSCVLGVDAGGDVLGHGEEPGFMDQTRQLYQELFDLDMYVLKFLLTIVRDMGLLVIGLGEDGETSIEGVKAGLKELEGISSFSLSNFADFVGENHEVKALLGFDENWKPLPADRMPKIEGNRELEKLGKWTTPFEQIDETLSEKKSSTSTPWGVRLAVKAFQKGETDDFVVWRGSDYKPEKLAMELSPRYGQNVMFLKPAEVPHLLAAVAETD